MFHVKHFRKPVGIDPGISVLVSADLDPTDGRTSSSSGRVIL